MKRKIILIVIDIVIIISIHSLQKYVVNYNQGNILYQNGEYESAIEEYKKALNSIAPKYKRCKIRINYALTICKTVEVNENDEDSIRKAIKTYERAINVLTEEGCANENDNKGHSQKAEQLKKDIQKEIDRLKELQEEHGSNEDNNQKEPQDSKEPSETIESKIQGIKEEAMQEQRELETQYKNYEKDFREVQKNW